MSSTLWKIAYVLLAVVGFVTYVVSDPPTWFVGWFTFMIGSVGLGLELLNDRLNGKGRG